MVPWATFQKVEASAGPEKRETVAKRTKGKSLIETILSANRCSIVTNDRSNFNQNSLRHFNFKRALISPGQDRDESRHNSLWNPSDNEGGCPMSLEIGQRGAPVITRQRTAPVALPPDGESPSSSTSLPLTSSAKPQRTGIAALTLGDIWDGIAGFFKRTFQLVRNFIGNRLAEPKPLDQENAAIAQAYCLLPSNENVQAFLDEVQSYEKQGAIGPGAPTDSVKSLQDSLKQLGYNILVNGNFDQATTSAVLDFKSRNGIHQNYVMADGKVAVNEYADSATLKLLQQKLVIEKPVTPQPVITPPVLTPPITASRPPLDQTLLRGNEAIIKQYNLFPSKENVDAFLAETQAYKTNGSLGPGMEAPADIKEMQTIL
ncbi:MAG TPA: hypothetical protein DD435_00550, partial [Cyanobacteria bacterium UBA8530]|nr:hypothetical protein [Cyanobacteria bacterium UBA8530]